MMKFKSRKDKLEVSEAMTALLYPMMPYLNSHTEKCVGITLRILQETEIEEEMEGTDEI